jgi:membrane-associated phospholipid phosphatase
MLHNKTRVSLLLGLVFAVNLLETEFIEGLLEMVRARYGFGAEWRAQLAWEFHQFEGNYIFESHDTTSALAVYGYSISYFFLIILLSLGVAIALYRRKEISAYRVFALGIAIAYGLSLPFYLFFPVVERWAYPDSGAMLLSDLWTSKLIEMIRPMSGLDNCFPSFHVSATVVTVLVCFLFQVRLRLCVLFLGLTVILSTFILGIHWSPDILAGVAVGVISVWLAVRLARALPATAPIGSS